MPDSVRQLLAELVGVCACTNPRPTFSQGFCMHFLWLIRLCAALSCVIDPTEVCSKSIMFSYYLYPSPCNGHQGLSAGDVRRWSMPAPSSTMMSQTTRGLRAVSTRRCSRRDIRWTTNTTGETRRPQNPVFSGSFLAENNHFSMIFGFWSSDLHWQAAGLYLPRNLCAPQAHPG